MSTYLKMWGRVKELSTNKLQEWIGRVSPANGVMVDFYGIHVADVDLLEALKYTMDQKIKREL